MIGKTILELSSVDSTNAYANRVYPATEFEDGTIIWAHEQFAGRGQHDHCWSSEAGKNLTLSVCLKPRFLSPDRQFQLNKAISLGVLDFIRSFTPADSWIKWPNDLYTGDRKIGGILIENKIMGSVFEASIAGIGINVNQTFFSTSIPNPVSLIQILGYETELNDALQTLCRFLSQRYAELKRSDHHHLDQEYDRNIMGFGQWRFFSCDGASIEGIIKGVDESGRLLVTSRGGETNCFSHGEIGYVL